MSRDFTDVVVIMCHVCIGWYHDLEKVYMHCLSRSRHKRRSIPPLPPPPSPPNTQCVIPTSAGFLAVFSSIFVVSAILPLPLAGDGGAVVYSDVSSLSLSKSSKATGLHAHALPASRSCRKLSASLTRSSASSLPQEK